MLGLAASLVLFALLLGFRDGMYGVLSAYTDSMNADLIVSRSGVKGSFSANTLPAAIHSEIASTSKAEEIEHALAADIILALGDIKTPATLVGYEPESGVGGPWSLTKGRSIWADGEITLDTWLARQAGISLGDQIEVLGQPFTVVGLTRETSSWLGVYLFMSRSSAENLLQVPGTASFYWLRLPPGADVTAVAQEIEAQNPGVEAITPAAVAGARRNTLAAVLDTPLTFILLVGLVIGMAVMGLTAYTAVIGRMREYGVIMALGANRRWLRKLVILETVYRATLGLLLGIGLSYLTAELIIRAFPQFTITLRAEALLLTSVAALLMTLIAALLPLRRIASIDAAVVFKA